MNLNTRYKAQNIKNYFLTFTFATIIFMVIDFIYWFDKYPNITYIAIGIAILVFGWFYAKKFLYIEYIDDDQKIILRFFKLIPSALDHKSIEVPKQFFISYETKKSFMGLREELILIVKTRDGVSKYPPVSLSILSDSQKNQILGSLKKNSKR